MFTPEDYWMILQYLERFKYYKDLYQCSADDSVCIGKAKDAASAAVPELDSTIKSLADSERTKALSLFENTIDQSCFGTEDYKRIRSFLIDWYSSLKTQVTLGRDSHDVFVLPPDYLNELIRSFGYLYPADIPSVNIRVNFFLDLVNLYKIKGTPLSLKRALDYYGMKNVDFAEYWLRKNEQGELIFRGVSVFPPLIKIPWPDVKFGATSGDPHWFQTEQDVIELLERNAIRLPSKTPYFGLRPFFSLSEIQQTMAVLVRMMGDQYQTWKSTGTLQKDIKLNLFNITVSALENYLACVYVVNTSFPYHETSLYGQDSYLCYDGTSEVVSDIVNTYENLTSYPVWNADDPEGEIAFRQARVDAFNDLFTRPNSQNYLKTKIGVDSAGDILESINPDFKAVIDSYIASGKYYQILASLLQDLSGWIRIRISTNATDLISIILGVSASPIVARIINFFKPYRARLFATQFWYIIDNPTVDCVRIYDRRFELKVIEKIYDYATADSLACCGDDSTSCSDFDTTSIVEPLLYSREYYDCGSFHDIGIVWDQPLVVHYTSLIRDSLNCHIEAPCYDGTNVDGWYWYDATSACDFWGNWMDSPIDTDSTSDIELIVAGGFRDFDTCGVFDCLAGNDIVKIQLRIPVLEADFTGDPLAGYESSPLPVQFTDTSHGLSRHWGWDFGDGQSSVQQNPINPYSIPGPGGLLSSFTSAVTGPLTLSFTNTSTGTPTSYLWDFGDGETSTDENPIHVFPEENAYLVRLTIFNANGNSRSEQYIVMEI